MPRDLNTLIGHVEKQSESNASLLFQWLVGSCAVPGLWRDRTVEVYTQLWMVPFLLFIATGQKEPFAFMAGVK